MKIRRAKSEDAKEISAVIKSVTHYFVINADGSGAEEFLKAIEPPAIQKLIESEEFQYFVGLIQGQIAGVVAIREGKHLFHLFVAEIYQGKKLGQKLWDHVKQVVISTGNVGHITVNSTLFAVPIYERFGFRKTGEKVETNGIAYVPMAIHLPSRMPPSISIDTDGFAADHLQR